MPAASISAEGRGLERNPPATACELTFETSTGAVQVNPPFVELNASTVVSNALFIGTTTRPFGCTSGCPPIPVALLAVGVEGPQVSPPSVDVFISMRLPAPLLSHSI